MYILISIIYSTWTFQSLGVAALSRVLDGSLAAPMHACSFLPSDVCYATGALHKNLWGGYDVNI